MVRTTSSTGFHDEPSDILLVSNDEWIYTEAELHLLFSPYGPVEKVLIIQELPVLQALVKFQSEQCAINAWNSLQGSLQIQFYKLRDELVSRGVGTGFDSELKGSTTPHVRQNATKLDGKTSTPHVSNVCNESPSANSSSGSKRVSGKPLLAHVGVSSVHVVPLVLAIAVPVLIWLWFMYGIIMATGHFPVNKNLEVGVANITFNDVKGVDEAKAVVEEIVYYLKDPERFTRLGGKLPKGVLLTGPPGTGKTMLAEALAAHSRVPFFSTMGSEFVCPGAEKFRILFSAAKKQSPCIIFIDDIDTIGGAPNGREPQNFRMLLKQLLIELDGFNQNEGIIVIGATNSPESLDKALVKPGRFDRHVVVPLPDVEGRRQILEVHMAKVIGGDDVNLRIIARGTPGFSGADLANLVNSAAIRAASTGAEVVSMSHLEYAKNKIRIIMDDRKRKSAVYYLKNLASEAMHW